MAKATENTAQAPAPEAPAKKGKLKLILIGVGALALVGGAFFGGTMMSKGKQAPAATEEVKPTTDGEIASDAEGGKKEGEKKESAEKGKEGKEGKKGEEGKEAKEGKEGKEGEGKGEGAEGAATAAAGADLKFEFDRITTNLLDPTMRQYVQLSLTLEAGSPEGLEAIQANEVPLRDATLMLLGSKTKEEMAPAGRERLKKELMTKYEGIVEPKTISNIYISNIVVMRQ